eukprot:g26654.t1
MLVFVTVYKDLITIGGAETQVDFLVAFPVGATRASADSTKITIVNFVEAAWYIEQKAPKEWFKNLLGVEKLTLVMMHNFVREVNQIKRTHKGQGGQGWKITWDIFIRRCWTHDTTTVRGVRVGEEPGVVISGDACLKRDVGAVRLVVRAKRSLREGQIFCSECLTPDMLDRKHPLPCNLD